MKEKLNIIKNILKSTFESYPVVYSTSIIYSIICCILYDSSGELLSELTIPFVIFFCLSFVVESIFKNKSNKKIGYIIVFIISIIFGLFSFNIFSIESIIFNRVILYSILSSLLIGIYFNYKRTKKTFSNYFKNVFSNMLKVFIINTILICGLSLITLVFDYLILNNSSDSLVLKTIILVLGFYFVPAIVYSTKKYDKISKFISILTNRILFILVLIAYLIIYIYIFKIIITWTIPSNMIFRILSALFVISTIVSIMVKDSEENIKFKKINDFLPYLFIPFIILQIYSLGIRISLYGLTTVRYLGIALLIIEIIYTIFIIRKIDIGKIIFVLVIELFIVILFPYLNYSDLPANMQLKILIKYKDTDLSKARSAYRYIVSNNHGELIENVLTSEEKEKLIDDTIDPEYNIWNYLITIDGDISLNKLDIYGYRNMYIINDSDINKEYVLKINDIKLDLMPYLKECINNSSDFQKYFETNNEIIIDSNRKIIFENMHISYYDENIDYLYFNGYLLEK